MQSTEKQAVIEAGLDQAFGKLSDITPIVLSAYYDRYPEAKIVFGEHGYDQVAQLEASMVDSALYFVETWFQQPKEIQETIENAIPQHESLNIPVPLILGLLDTLLDIIIGSIPSMNTRNSEVWEELRLDLKNQIMASSESP
ncbi:MAG: hypothetical protein GQ538_11845 [Xanthomonadales bacterium]|nr:hypothetical protein [Xanthomonadales bacterium]